MENLTRLDLPLKSLFVPLTTKKAITIIILLGILIYFNAMFGEFVFDDIGLILQNPSVHSINNLFQNFTTTASNPFFHGRYYRPLELVVFSILYSSFGESTFFYHFIQLSIHIGNSILVYLLFKQLFKNKIALISSIIFLIHPINVENVAYISDLQEVLFLFFGLLALYLFQKVSPFSLKIKTLISVLILLSLLSKETGILFIPLIILSSFLFGERKKIIQSVYLTLIPFGIYGVFRNSAIHQLVTYSPTPDVLRTTMLTIPKIIYYYLSTFIFPKNLFIDQMWLVNSYSYNDFLIPLIFDLTFFILVFAFGFFVWKKDKKNFAVFLFFLTWYLLGSLIHLQLWLVDMTVADRWFYMSLIGLLGILALACSSLKIKNQALKKASYLFIATIIIALSIRTLARNIDWQTRLGLYKHDASYSNNTMVYRLLEEEYINRKDITNAEKTLTQLEKLDQNNPYSLKYKADIELLRGNINNAKKYYNQLLETQYDYLAYKSLLNIAINSNNYKDAETLLKNGIKKHPNDTTLWKALLNIEIKLGDKNEAQKAEQQLLLLN